MSVQRFWHFQAIYSSMRSRGLWSGIRLAFILARSALRTWAGAHRRVLGALAMTLLMFGALWLGTSTAASGAFSSGGAVWLAAILLALSVSGFAIGAAHFVLIPVQRSQVIYRALNGIAFAAVVGFVAFLGFERWSALYRADSASATLWGLIAVTILFGAYEIITWFIRSAMFQSVSIGEANDLLAFSAEGRWKAAIHEAGHAVAYGLCATVPEDAYACIDPDLLTDQGGAVGVPSTKDATDLTKERIEWHMICTEAGSAAEELFFGDRSVIGAMDATQFNDVAFSYLVAGFGEVVNIKPDNELEILANRAAIGRVRERNKEITKAFLAQNRAAIDRIAKQLLETEFMNCETLAIALKDVVPIDGRPLMTWPASIQVIPR